MKRIAFALILAMIPAGAAGQDKMVAAKAEAIRLAWQGWVEKHQISEAALAVSYQGEIVAKDGVGRTADTPAPVASLTKAITGICVARLVEKGEFDFSTPLGEIVPETGSEVTLSALLDQTSGYRKDITQQSPDGYPGLDREYLEWVSMQEIAAHRKGPGSAKFRYNNANYAMLGLAISRVTAKPYEQACAELVLEPAGVKQARLNPDWRIMSSWGGWKLSATDYLRFVSAHFDNTSVLGRDPGEFPNVELGGGAFYGMGYVFRKGRNGGRNFWHDGRWETRLNGKPHRFSAYFAKWDNGWAIAVNQNISALKGEIGELDILLSTASHKK